MNAQEDPEIDTEHRVFDAFRLTGYGPDALVDPGRVTREDIEDGGWKLAKWQTHGVTLFGIGAGAVVDAEWSPAGVGVEYNGAATQPIGFVGVDDTAPLNSHIRPMTQLRGMANETVVFLVPPDAEPDVPTPTSEEAVKALGLWGSEGWLTREAADALAEAFDTSFEDKLYREDPDADGVEIARASHVVQRLGSAAGVEPTIEESNAIGHKKRRREVFHGNLQALADRHGVTLNDE